MSGERIGFVGPGVMGAPMVQRLLRAGWPVKVWARAPARMGGLVVRGASLAPSPRQLAERSDVVVGCLLNTATVRSVYFGEDGILAGVRPGSVIVEHATFTPSLALELAERASDRGAVFLDAPVSGGRAAAVSGNLVVMIGGGDQAIVPLVEKVLGAYATAVAWAGGAGRGLYLKLINQMLVTTHSAAAGEAAALIERLDIDPAIAARVLARGWGQSAMIDRNLSIALTADVAADSDAPLGGLLEAQQLITEITGSLGLPAPVFDEASARFREAVSRGWNRRDLAAIASLDARTDNPHRTDMS